MSEVQEVAPSGQAAPGPLGVKDGIVAKFSNSPRSHALAGAVARPTSMITSTAV